MKTPKNITLIYDSECPICISYTNLFIKQNLLDKKGRVAYNELSNGLKIAINTDRARNEIALLDHETGKVTYGAESISKILANKWPIIGKLYKIEFIKYIVTKLYFFISYNRKIILPTSELKDTCVPDVRYKYRWLYMIMSWLIISPILFHYSKIILPEFTSSNMNLDLIISGGQIIFQSIALFALKQKKKMDYLGNMMTVSLAGAILLIPILIINLFITIPTITLGWFFIVVTFMFIEHWRRVKLLGLSWILTPSWMLYRILVLMAILLLKN